jgi:hypothetical protein
MLIFLLSHHLFFASSHCSVHICPSLSTIRYISSVLAKSFESSWDYLMLHLPLQLCDINESSAIETLYMSLRAIESSPEKHMGLT